MKESMGASTIVGNARWSAHNVKNILVVEFVMIRLKMIWLMLAVKAAIRWIDFKFATLNVIHVEKYKSHRQSARIVKFNSQDIFAVFANFSIASKKD